MSDLKFDLALIQLMVPEKTHFMNRRARATALALLTQSSRAKNLLRMKLLNMFLEAVLVTLPTFR